MRRILIVNPFGIGDVLFTTPMIALLQARFPGVAISYLTSGRAALFLKNDPRLAHVFAYDRDDFVAVYKKSPWQFFLKWERFLKEIQSVGFDAVFDLSLNRGIGFFLMLAGIPTRIGYDYQGRGCFLTQKHMLRGFSGRHVVEHHVGLLKMIEIDSLPGPMTAFTLKEDDLWAESFLKEHNIKSFVGGFPGGGASWGKGGGVRRWSPENHAKLADKIVEKASCPIILMGDKADLELCKVVSDGMCHSPIIVAGRASLGQSAALMKRCRCLVMNDGGAMHIATALGVKTAVVFGPVDEKIYGPFPVSEQVIAAKDILCRPCYRNFRMSDCLHLSCLKMLTVDEVFRKVEPLL